MGHQSDNEFYRMKEIVAKRKAEHAERYKEQSRQRLRKIITSRMRTTMIGSLSVIENYFGDLWGHNSNGKLTPEQARLSELWEQARADILDKGNANIRAVEDELSNYNCEWKRYQTEFIIKKQDIRSDEND